MRRNLPAILAGALLLAACTASEEPSPTASADPTAEPTPSASASPSPTPSPTDEPTPSESAIPSVVPSASASGGAGGFGIPSNPAADALFLDRDECENPELGYTLEFPEDWWTNTSIGDVPACSWFSPTFYEVPDPSVVPDEIAIEIFVVPGDRGYLRRVLEREEVVVGATQLAVRVLVDGTGDGSDGGTYEYVVQLGPTFEEGPNLIARTDTAMGGEFDLNRGVLDRMMATIRFIGTIQ
ncbi:MAG: hypothetical protein K5924_09015 [Chloroflexi bacterium]|nr:hypothetical protein [Chloroflexota bacterium]